MRELDLRDSLHSIVTGVAGFIGSHLCDRLIRLGHTVTGIDCLTTYYSVESKMRNLDDIRKNGKFTFRRVNLATADLSPIMRDVDYVFHLAAQPGVRGSWSKNFQQYVTNNILSTQAVLEATKGTKVKKVVFASSSSIFGDKVQLPTTEEAIARPVSPYGVTKLAAENLCRAYHQNFSVPTVALRYFTVYGSRQRPDMAFYRFIDSTLSGSPVVVYGDGTASRDFTHVSDVVEATILAMERANPGEAFNVGSGKPIVLNEAISILANVMGKDIKVRYEGPVRGDVKDTYADIRKATSLLGFRPRKSLSAGLIEQVEWQRGLNTAPPK